MIIIIVMVKWSYLIIMSYVVWICTYLQIATERIGPALVEDLSILLVCDPTGNGHTAGSLPVIGGSVSVLV